MLSLKLLFMERYWNKNIRYSCCAECKWLRNCCASQVVLAAIILVWVYILIGFDVSPPHSTTQLLLYLLLDCSSYNGCLHWQYLYTRSTLHDQQGMHVTSTLTIMSQPPVLFPQRPTLEEVVEWLDLDTICLLFGMASA